MANTYEEILGACYEAYMRDWKDAHVTPEAEAQALAEYEEAVRDDPMVRDAYPTFGDWVEERGFGGSIWACLDEFEGAEFRDPAYMGRLLADGAMWTAWLDVSDPSWWPAPHVVARDGWASRE